MRPQWAGGVAGKVGGMESYGGREQAEWEEKGLAGRWEMVGQLWEGEGRQAFRWQFCGHKKFKMGSTRSSQSIKLAPSLFKPESKPLN